MNNEINSIIRELENTLAGEPWFGRPINELIEEVDDKIAFTIPVPGAHSLVELLYHMITWAGFTLKRIERDQVNDMAAVEKLDWREIDPQIHGWKEGIEEFKDMNNQIINLLKSKKDTFLDEKVDFRNYNFRFLLQGIIQHNIYHAGQIAYLKKLL
jgi:uncharacterized damage-inducible protein DinB